MALEIAKQRERARETILGKEDMHALIHISIKIMDA